MTPEYYESERQRLRRLEKTIAQIKTGKRTPDRAQEALLTALQKERDTLLACTPRHVLQKATGR